MTMRQRTELATGRRVLLLIQRGIEAAPYKPVHEGAAIASKGISNGSLGRRGVNSRLRSGPERDQVGTESPDAHSLRIRMLGDLVFHCTISALPARCRPSGIQLRLAWILHHRPAGAGSARLESPRGMTYGNLYLWVGFGQGGGSSCRRKYSQCRTSRPNGPSSRESPTAIHSTRSSWTWWSPIPPGRSGGSRHTGRGATSGA